MPFKKGDRVFVRDKKYVGEILSVSLDVDKDGRYDVYDVWGPGGEQHAKYFAHQLEDYPPTPIEETLNRGEIKKGLHRDTIDYIASEISHDVRCAMTETEGFSRIRWNNRAMGLALATIAKLESHKNSVKAPCCPDCKQPMVYITEDMTGQGGPPEDTWLCAKKECGRALGASGTIRFSPTLE